MHRVQRARLTAHAVAGQLERVVRHRRGRAASDDAGRQDKSVVAKRRGICSGRRAPRRGKALACANLSAKQVARESADVGVHLRGLTFELSWPQRHGALDSKRKMGRRPSA